MADLLIAKGGALAAWVDTAEERAPAARVLDRDGV
jgi:hypothetical protein